MDAIPQRVEVYQSVDGDRPFDDWLNGLRDREARGRVRARLNRLRVGNFGDVKSVGAGVLELRIDFGPGYRVYFGRDGDRVVILLGGGDKQTQRRDIERAKQQWSNYLGEGHANA